MKILHTADWHLGKTIEDRSRKDEQEAFIDEICEIANTEEINLVLIAGDIFQSPNPGSEAQKMFFDALDRLSDGGRRGVVVIAGNHDSPDRLAAPVPWADKLGITLIGYPGDELQAASPADQGAVSRVACGPSWLELAIPGQDHNAVIVALPYPSEGRLKEILGTMNMADQLTGYNEKLREMLSQLGAHYRSDTVNLLMTHLFVRNGILSDADSELDIQMGGAYAVEPQVLDIGAQYVALGHLHRPQKVSGCGAPARYAGSPLPYGFAEANYTKSVVIVEIEPGKEAVVREVSLSTKHPLVRWIALGGLPEVYQKIEDGQDLEAYIDLEIHSNEIPTGVQIQELRKLRPRILNIWTNTTAQNEEKPDNARLSNLSLEEVFTRYYEKQSNGMKPDSALTELFLKLVVEIDQEEERGDMYEAD